MFARRLSLRDVCVCEMSVLVRRLSLRDVRACETSVLARRLSLHVCACETSVFARHRRHFYDSCFFHFNYRYWLRVLLLRASCTERETLFCFLPKTKEKDCKPDKEQQQKSRRLRQKARKRRSSRYIHLSRHHLWPELIYAFRDVCLCKTSKDQHLHQAI